MLCEYKEKEYVRKQRKSKGNKLLHARAVSEKQINGKRKLLYRKMKAARQEGKQSWISYDTLYIDGKPVKN